MFSSRKPPSDVKKTSQKVLDPRKDNSARLKHFKLLFDSVDFKEAQNLFSGRITSLYSCFHDAFEVAESNLRQKGQKQQREELENAMLVFEKILYLFPEHIKRGCYIHSTTQIFRKLLHPKNSPRLRKEAMRLFLLWYGLLGTDAKQDQHVLFCVMVPGLPGVCPRLHRWMCLHYPTEAVRPVGWCCEDEPFPMLPLSPGEPSLAETRSVLEHFLTLILPHDKSSTAQKQFTFLFEMFKLYYMPVIFPDFRWSTSLYKPCLELPDLHGESERPVDSPLAECQEAVIKWICKFIQPPARVPHHIDRKSSSEGMSDGDFLLTEFGEESDYMIGRELLLSTPANVNFLHEVLRQAFLLHVRQCQTTLQVIHIYKDWIQMKGIEIPQFMMEPLDPHSTEVLYGGREKQELIGALHNLKSYPEVRAGIQKLLQLFIVNAANCFLLELGPGSISHLNRQVDLCKRVLNIYRYMVMNVRMDPSTWTQLLLVLLQITTQIVKRDPPIKKSETLGGKLAPALFQTLIVTWIKASLNVSVSVELWDQFLGVVSSLTQWEELIKEWGKTMDTLTRVMARLMYNLNLNDLPLDKLNEGVRNRKKRPPPTVTHNTSTKSFSRSWSRYGSFISDGQNTHKEKEANRTGLRPNGHVPISTETPSTSTTLAGKKSLSEGNLPLLEDSTQDAEVSKLTSDYSCRVVPKHLYSSVRCRSLELLPVIGTEETIRQSRSPSPAPSGASISKDSPMSIEVLNPDSSIESTEIADTESRSVMAQGPVKGWQPEVAVALWCRMLGALGDPNNLKPSIHALVFNYLNELANTLIKLRKNQGLSLDNQWSPPPPDAIPPIHYFTPWCFKAAAMTQDKGRLLAYQTLLTVTLQKPDIPLSRDYLAMFYIIMHKGLASNDQAVVNCIVEHCEWRLMCLNIAGSSMLLLDLITAVESIVYSNNIKMPRTEALKLVASILGDLQHSHLPVLVRDPNKLVVQNVSNLSEKVVKILKYCGRKDPDSLAQCMALCSLGTKMYGELSSGSSLDDSLSVLIAALQSKKSVCMQVAADVVSVLTPYLVRHYGTIPWSMLESLSCALGHEDKKVVSTVLFTLAGWCMSMPKHALVSSLLYQVFKVLHQLLEEAENTSPSVPHIHITNSPRSSRLKSFMSEASNRKPNKLAKLAAHNVLSHLINQLLHFPMRCGAARVSSVVVENDDIAGLNSDDLHYEAFLQPNLELFMVNESLLLSLIELPSLDEAASASLGLLMAERQVRLIVRDISGKITWDTSVLFAPQENVSGSKVTAEEVLEACSRSQKEHKSEENVYVGGTLRHRPSSVLPHYKETSDDLDNLDDLLAYMRHSSKECITVLNDPTHSAHEHDWITTALNQRNFEMDFCHKHRSSNIMNAMSEVQPQSLPPASAFQHSRLLFSQLGLSAWEQRLQVHLVQKNQKLLRELKNLDNQPDIEPITLVKKCRETHKFAVIYVAEGQEDKTSILSNNGGSDAYEEFVAGLGWEVELCMHTGFVGGLHRNGVSGDTAPYYADSFTEVLFHVATRMPTHTEEALLQKTRHLGNDEVHIVWSEHVRDYRRGIIPTEFCDVLIVIYPLNNSLYRIQIERKSEVGFFGPLFDGATVEQRVLPGLVRATAINASRAKRAGLPMYQNYYEERAGALQTIFESYRAQTTFEEFMASVCCTRGYGGPDMVYVRSPLGLTAALLDANSLSVGSVPATRTNSSDT